MFKCTHAQDHLHWVYELFVGKRAVGAFIAPTADLSASTPLHARLQLFHTPNRTRRRDLLLFLVPPLSFAIIIGAIQLATTLIAPHISFPNPRAIAISVIFLALFLLAAIASTAAISLSSPAPPPSPSSSPVTPPTSDCSAPPISSP